MEKTLNIRRHVIVINSSLPIRIQTDHKIIRGRNNQIINIHYPILYNIYLYNCFLIDQPDLRCNLIDIYGAFLFSYI